LWQQHCAVRLSKTLWSPVTGMAVQSSEPLEQQINRAELANEPVEIEIQTLFDDLSCY